MSSLKSVNKKYGWRADKPDQRDHKFTAFRTPASLPSFVDLRSHFPAPFNQFDLGSCTANAIAGAVEFDLIRQNVLLSSKSFMPSRLFIYYNERVIEGSVSEDAGAEIRDGFKTLNQQGVCAESEWPYNTAKFAIQPPSNCYADALKARSVNYQSINQDLTSMKSCLAGGFGFCYGFSVYESFESDAVARNGIVPMPSATESMIGGHAVVTAGYNDGPATVNGVPPQTFIVRNSWGPNWGAKGYFFMPYSYLTNQNLSSDFWKVSVMAS